MTNQMSEYFLKLQRENFEVADRLGDEVLSTNPKEFPAVTNMDIVAYLVFTTGFYTNDQLRAYKSLSAFKYFEAGFVSGCGVAKINGMSVVKAKVKHSQKMNLSPLQVWVICEESGAIKTAHCNCMAGLGEVCSHVGALLYALEYIATSRQNISCTDVKSLWKIPSVTKVECQPISEMAYGRIFKYSFNNDVPSLNNQEIEMMMSEIEEAGSPSVLMRCIEPFATQLCHNREVTVVQNPYANLYRVEFEAVSLEELRQLAKNFQISMSEDECESIKQGTVQQSKSQEWFRAGRVTASNFKKTINTSLTMPSLSLIKMLCYPLKMSFRSKPTDWGRKHENDALTAYINQQKMCHENVAVEAVGLCIKPEYPQLAASPDGIVTCCCCGSGCVEVKCPYLLKDRSILEFCQVKQTCLISCEEGVYLDKNHGYFYQIQQQMALTNTLYRDFVVWSPKDLFVERILLNEDFWASESQKSSQFHQEVIMPELLGKHFTKSKKDIIYCICKTVDDGTTPMICCENENCDIQWYHMKCVGLTEVPDDLWICSFCS